MTTVAPAGLSGWLDSAGTSGAAALTIGEQLQPEAPRLGSVDVDLPVAVLVGFSGAASGELALFVDQEIAQALQTSTIGAIDPADAFAPVIQAVADALGLGALGAAQALDGRMAATRIGGHAENGTVSLRSVTGVRAAIAIGVDKVPATARGSQGIDRFDLLRGVEMQASVELGRARMTINDLLSLRGGEVIELDRLAGEPADLFVNGRMIARGEVVVVDENYGLRITQIVTDENAR